MAKKDNKKQKQGFGFPNISLPKVEMPDLGIKKAADVAVGVLDGTQKAIVKAIDQNGDGELNLKDVVAVVDSFDKAVDTFSKDLDKKKLEKERKTLKPIFVEDLDKTNFLMSKLIRITEMDKKHADSLACNGSIGHISQEGELRVINLYKKKLRHYGLTFYPDSESDVYYVDPSDRDNYIAIEHYFDYLKVQRINELQKIAQDLGAKHFKVTYKEEKSSSAKMSAKVKAKGKGIPAKGAMDASHDNAKKNFESIKIAAEMDCPGHAPIMPKLHYLKNDPNIQSLIDLRMDSNSPILHQKYTIQFSASSGMKEKDALKIDAAMTAMKINVSTNGAIALEASNEKRKSIEYEIDF